MVLIAGEKEEKFVDKRTGREVLTEAPHGGFKWQEGKVLRALTPEETTNYTGTNDRALIGGDGFEWVSKDEVEIEKSE